MNSLFFREAIHLFFVRGVKAHWVLWAFQLHNRWTEGEGGVVPTAGENF